jgi:hypothetical protein
MVATRQCWLSVTEARSLCAQAQNEE